MAAQRAQIIAGQTLPGAGYCSLRAGGEPGPASEPVSLPVMLPACRPAPSWMRPSAVSGRPGRPWPRPGPRPHQPPGPPQLLGCSGVLQPPGGRGSSLPAAQRGVKSSVYLTKNISGMPPGEQREPGLPLQAGGLVPGGLGEGLPEAGCCPRTSLGGLGRLLPEARGRSSPERCFGEPGAVQPPPGSTFQPGPGAGAGRNGVNGCPTLLPQGADGGTAQAWPRRGGTQETPQRQARESWCPGQVSDARPFLSRRPPPPAHHNP